VTGFPGCVQHLVDKAPAAAAIADASEPDIELVIAAVHECGPLGVSEWPVPERGLKNRVLLLRAAREPTDAPGGNQAMSMAWFPPGAPLLSRRRAVVLELPSCLTAKHANSCEIARNAVIPIMARSAVLTWARRDCQPVAECGSDARSECQTFAPRLQADLLLHHRSANAQTGGT